MKKNTMNQQILRCLIALLPFPLLYILTKLFLPNVYLFEWMARHWYCGLWCVEIVLLFFNTKLAIALSYINVISIVLGQLLGDILQKYNIAQITSDMNAEQQAYLHLHHGFQIWLLSLFFLMTIYVVIILIRKRKKTV